MFERPVKGYMAERLLNVTVCGQVRKDKLCKLVPRSIYQHASFIVETVWVVPTSSVLETMVAGQGTVSQEGSIGITFQMTQEWLKCKSIIQMIQKSYPARCTHCVRIISDTPTSGSSERW